MKGFAIGLALKQRRKTTRKSPIHSNRTFDYDYQNAFRCNLCNEGLCHARAILYKRKKKASTVACLKAFWYL